MAQAAGGDLSSPAASSSEENLLQGQQGRGPGYLMLTCTVYVL